MVHPLRCRGPEPLADKVRAAPGYHIHPKSKRVYSDDLSAHEINRIAKQIKREFWTPAQKLKTAWKAQRLLLDPFSVPQAAAHWLKWQLQDRPDPWGDTAADKKFPNDLILST